MRRLAFAVPGDLATPTGGYQYDRCMIEELRRQSWQVDVVDLGEGFPRPDAATRAAAEAVLRAVAAGCPVVVDGLALGVLPDAARAVAANRPLIALVHHPLALENGLSPAEAAAFQASERAALSAARAVIVTSPSTARIVCADYGVAKERIAVALPGSERFAPAQGSRDGRLRLLSVGSLVPRKGFDVLAAALATLAELPWTLTIVGDRTRDPVTAARLDAEIARLGMADRIERAGAVQRERLHAFYAAADLFVLASRFEGYGMAYAEAIAHGLPVIGTTAGAIPDTVPAEAGILVPTDDIAALSQALLYLMTDTTARCRMANAARLAAERLPTWADSAKIFAAAVEAAA